MRTGTCRQSLPRSSEYFVNFLPFLSIRPNASPAVAKSVWKIVFTLVVLVGVQRAPLPLKAGLSAVSAALLALNGAQKGSLSESGALAAFTVGTLSLFASTRASWSLIGFYLSSSSLTSFASAAKSSIGDEYGTAPKRSWVQVRSSSHS